MHCHYISNPPLCFNNVAFSYPQKHPRSFSKIKPSRNFLNLRNSSSFNQYKPSILLGDIGNSAGADQTPQNAGSYQGLHFLLIECSIKIRIKMKNVHLITVRNSIRYNWVE